MGMLATIVRDIRASEEERKLPGNSDDFWYNDVPMSSDAGIPISRQTAMTISTFWKCVRWKGGQFGMLPKKMFERTTLFDQPAQIEAPDHNLYAVIHTAPNPAMPSMAFFEMLSADLDRDGNFYAYIQRKLNSSRIKYLWRLRPDRVRIATESITGADGTTVTRLWYYISDDKGIETKFYPDEILHIPGLGFDGVKGYNPVQLHMNTLGWNRALVRYGGQFFKSAGRPSAIVNTPAAIKDPVAKKELVDSLTASGKKAGAVVLIEGALTYTPMAITQDEAQFIETFHLQEEDMAGILGVKPHKIGIMRNMTNNNIEQQNIESVTDCLQPLCVRVEQWINLKLLSDAPSTGLGGGTERDRYFMECELKGLLRGDTAAQTAFLEKMTDRAVFSPNQSLRYLGMSGYAGGDRRYINGAYIPVDRIDEVIDKRIPPPQQAAAPAKNPAQLGASPEERTRKAYLGIFRDAAGRVIHRSARERAKSAASIFEHVLLSVATALDVVPPETFIADYLGGMGERAATWNDADKVAVDELERAIAAFSASDRKEVENEK